MWKFFSPTNIIITMHFPSIICVSNCKGIKIQLTTCSITKSIGASNHMPYLDCYLIKYWSLQPVRFNVNGVLYSVYESLTSRHMITMPNRTKHPIKGKIIHQISTFFNTGAIRYDNCAKMKCIHFTRVLLGCFRSMNINDSNKNSKCLLNINYSANVVPWKREGSV